MPFALGKSLLVIAAAAKTDLHVAGEWDPREEKKEEDLRFAVV